jgi:hypothetical protein
MARNFRLRLSKVFRNVAKGEQADWVSAVLRARPPKARPDGEPMGGSLVQELSSPKIIRVKRWGYVLDLFSLGGKGHLLTFFIRGAIRGRGVISSTLKRRGVRSGSAKDPRVGRSGSRINFQPPRPLDVPSPAGDLERQTAKSIAAQFSAWDKRTKP